MCQNSLLVQTLVPFLQMSTLVVPGRRSRHHVYQHLKTRCLTTVSECVYSLTSHVALDDKLFISDTSYERC